MGVREGSEREGSPPSTRSERRAQRDQRYREEMNERLHILAEGLQSFRDSIMSEFRDLLAELDPQRAPASETPVKDESTGPIPAAAIAPQPCLLMFLLLLLRLRLLWSCLRCCRSYQAVPLLPPILFL